MKSADYHINVMKEYSPPHPPYGEEQEFYGLVSQGDVEGILRLRVLYGGKSSAPAETEKGVLSDSPLRNAIYHLVANCTIMTRRCIAAGMPQEEAYTLSDMFIRRADRCTDAAAVREVNDEMALEFASRMKRIHAADVSPVVRAAINYICDNLHSRLTVSAVAAGLGYNRSYLSALFRRETGESVSGYILKKRVETAKCLISGGMPLAEISQLLCFSSQSHFCRCFKNVTGTSPREYRDSLLRQPPKDRETAL